MSRPLTPTTRFGDGGGSGAGGAVRERFHDGFDEVRRELEIEETFSAEALAEAASPSQIAQRAGDDAIDRRDLHLVTIDPPTSMDLDQAYHAQRVGSGYRVHYAIADPAALIRPGGALDRETRRRGVTMYAPDRNTPLHPRTLSEDAASLLPGLDRPAVLWTMDLDEDAQLLAARLERANVRSREKLSYRVAQNRIDAGANDESLTLLREIGVARLALEAERGGVSLRLPSQEVTATEHGYTLQYDESLDVERWNAQISLLAGMAGGRLMLDAGVGLLRTLPAPPNETLQQIRQHGLALGIDWSPETTYQQRVRTLDPAVPEQVALLAFAVRALRGAGYLALDGQPEGDPGHWAIASVYGHVTAPLRRIGDRFANECLLAICADQAPPQWAVEAIDEMPETLGKARRRERALDRAIVDFTEAAILEARVGERFAAVVTTERRDGQVMIQLREPAVTAMLDAAVEPGEEITVELVSADPEARRVRFDLA